MKKILGIFLIIVGIVVAIQSFNLGDRFSRSPFSWEAESKEIRDAESIPMDGIKKVEVTVQAASVNIIPQNRDDVKAELKGTSSKEDRLTVTKNGNVLNLDVRNQNSDWFNFFGSRSLTLNVYIPMTYEGDLSLEAAAGNISLKGPAAGSPFQLDEFDIDVTAGNIYLSHIQVNEFEHRGSAGQLEADYLNTRRADIKISTGKLTLNHFYGELNGKTSTGKIHVQIDQLDHPVTLKSSTGNISLDLPEDGSFNLEASVSMGDIDNDFPMTITRMDKRDLEGTAGDGTHSIDLHVSTGNINVY